MNNFDKYITAGYTHILFWEEWDKNLQMFVSKMYPTFEDIVEIRKQKLESCIGVVRNVSAIRMSK